MARRNSLACILFLILWLFYTVIASSAAVLELKTGQKVEGDYLGGSATEIKFKVGSQVLVFPVGDVSRLHFTTSAAEGDFESDAAKALKVLKGIQSVTHAGVTVTEYSRRVNDAAVEVDAFLDKYKGRESQELLAEFRQAMSFYNEAATGWGDAFGTLWWKYERKIMVKDELMKACPTRYDAKAVEWKGLKSRPGETVFSYYTLSALWSCAGERVTKIEQLVTPK